MADACRELKGRVMTAIELGAALWPDRTGRRGQSICGGGDYAAQMLLGRMRKLGLVRTTHDPGASRWELTLNGHRVADLVAIAVHQARQLDAAEHEVTRKRCALDEAKSAIAAALEGGAGVVE